MNFVELHCDYKSLRSDPLWRSRRPVFIRESCWSGSGWPRFPQLNQLWTLITRNASAAVSWSGFRSFWLARIIDLICGYRLTHRVIATAWSLWWSGEIGSGEPVISEICHVLRSRVVKILIITDPPPSLLLKVLGREGENKLNFLI